MRNDRVKSSHIIPEVYIKNFAYTDKIHPNNTESVQVAYRENFNNWHQKGFGKKSIFTKNGIYDFTIIPEESQTVEEHLGKFETKMGIIVPKLEKNIPLDANDYFDITEFIISLINRTKEEMDKIQFFLKQIHDCFEDFDSSENKQYTKNYFYGYEDFSKLRILKTQKIMNKSKMFYESFYFIYNNTDTPFIASDNPVISEFISKNEIEGIFSFPVMEDITIDRKCLLLPLTPRISVLYCDYLDKKIINQNVITLLDSNIVFKMNMLQLRNCSEFIFSNIDNSNIDYAKAYKNWIDIDYTDKLFFITNQNKYPIQAHIVDRGIFDITIKISDVISYKSITDNICAIYQKGDLQPILVKSIIEINRSESEIIIKVKLN